MGYTVKDYSSDLVGKSDFNEAGLQILRLNDIWRDCKTNRHNGNLYGWRWALHDAWLELSHDAKKLGGHENDLSKNRFYVQKKMYDNLITKIMSLRNKKALFKVLSDVEEFMRDLQNQAGKGGKYRDSGMDGLSV